jgi:outer membrane protein
MRFQSLVALVVLAGTAANAQAPVGAQTQSTLTLDEAVSIARRNNPAYLQTENNRSTADAAVRQSYAALLPSVNTRLSTSYNQSGQQYTGGAQLSASADNIYSSYGIGLDFRLNSATLLNPRLQRANRNATDADITGAQEQLRSNVTQQYITVLQAQARADLQDTLVATARGQLELAKARVAVGAGTILDIRRAEVGVGQAEVQALTARNTVEVEKLRLYQQMGVPKPRNSDVALTTQFPVAQPAFSLDSLLDVARGRNPQLNALRSRERAAGVAVRVRQGQYAPTLSLSTGWGGQSYRFADANYLAQSGEAEVIGRRESCLRQDSIRTRLADPLPSLDCNATYVWTPDMAARARASNPGLFSFNKAPMSFSATLSLPIFDNLNREQALEQAQADREDARYSVRARELQMETDVTQAYLNLVTAARTVEMQETNAAKAREELAYAEERYRVGAATFLDVITSRGTFEQAQVDRINAIYSYHQAFAALESAVGRPLR